MGIMVLYHLSLILQLFEEGALSYLFSFIGLHEYHHVIVFFIVVPKPCCQPYHFYECYGVDSEGQSERWAGILPLCLSLFCMPIGSLGSGPVSQVVANFSFEECRYAPVGYLNLSICLVVVH